MSNAAKVTLVLVFVFLLVAAILMIGGQSKMQRTEETINTALTFSKNLTVKKDTSYGKYDYISPYMNGYAYVELNKKQGVIDCTGREITAIAYNAVWHFSEHAAVVEKDKMYGFIDTSGKEIVPLIYDFAVDFSEGLASVKKGDKWGYVNKKGEVVIPIIYDMAWAFTDHLGCVKKDLKWGFINKKGETIIPFKFDYVARKFENGRAKVELDGKTIVINTKGKTVG